MASAIDLAALNSYLMDKSYVNDEFEPTQADVILWNSLQNRTKEIDSFPFTARWFSHIASFDANEKKAFAASKDDLNAIAATVSSRLYFILPQIFRSPRICHHRFTLCANETTSAIVALCITSQASTCIFFTFDKSCLSM